MSDLTEKAATHLQQAEVDEHNAVLAAGVISNLRWTVAYALVAVARGVDELVQLTRAVHPSEAHQLDRRWAGTDTHDRPTS